MKRLLAAVLGILLILGGALAALNISGVTDFKISADGWWTVFIIAPSLYGLINNRGKLASLGTLLLGIYLLLAARDIISYGNVLKLLAPTVVVLVGIKFLVKAFSSGKTEPQVGARQTDFHSNSGKYKKLSSIAAVFGGSECNLYDAEFAENNSIDVLCVFGGADITVPDYVEVTVNAFSLFGGIDDKRPVDPTVEKTVKLTVNGFCMFGGVDIK